LSTHASITEQPPADLSSGLASNFLELVRLAYNGCGRQVCGISLFAEFEFYFPLILACLGGNNTGFFLGQGIRLSACYAVGSINVLDIIYLKQDRSKKFRINICLHKKLGLKEVMIPLYFVFYAAYLGLFSRNLFKYLFKIDEMK
jgi:hypothetical protein